MYVLWWSNETICKRVLSFLFLSWRKFPLKNKKIFLKIHISALQAKLKQKEWEKKYRSAWNATKWNRTTSAKENILLANFSLQKFIIVTQWICMNEKCMQRKRYEPCIFNENVRSCRSAHFCLLHCNRQRMVI